MAWKEYDDVPMCDDHYALFEGFKEGWWMGLRQGKNGFSCTCNGACYTEAIWDDYKKLLHENNSSREGKE